MIKVSLALARTTSARTCISLGLVLASGSALHAQSAPSVRAPLASTHSDLPPVVVTAPKRVKRASRPARPIRSTGAPAASTAAEPVRPNRINAQAGRETATSPVPGYVAQQSATGTKTDTRILENPQSISVVGRNQIEQQGAQTVAESLRYTAGVVPRREAPMRGSQRNHRRSGRCASTCGMKRHSRAAVSYPSATGGGA